MRYDEIWSWLFLLKVKYVIKGINHKRSVCLKMIYTTTVSLILNLLHVMSMNSERNLAREDGRCIFFCKLNASGSKFITACFAKFNWMGDAAKSST